MRNAHAFKPRRASPKSQRLEARVSPAQKRLFQEAADLYGTTLTDFVIKSAQEAAQRAVQDYEVMKLNARDREILVKALLNPPAPHPRLRAAAERYKSAAGL